MWLMLFAIAHQSNGLRMQNRLTKSAVMKPFIDGNAFKVISGLQNFDRSLVSNVAWAAGEGGASHIDIACDADLVRIAKSVTSLPVLVSSVVPQDFVAAVDAGADMIEIGNYDSFYDSGRQFSAADVIRMTIETRQLLPDIPLSVTIPHTLSIADQIVLAKQLEALGVDLIQTEGKMTRRASPGIDGVQELIEAAAPTIASAFALSRAVRIPVMCASGLSDVTAPLALAAGARGVGVGSAVNRLTSRQQMLSVVSGISAAIGRPCGPLAEERGACDYQASDVLPVAAVAAKVAVCSSM